MGDIDVTGDAMAEDGRFFFLMIRRPPRSTRFTYTTLFRSLTALKKGDRSNKFVSVASGALTGEWIEKGSRNLSGRIHVADMDTATNMIYCGSSGGNIWKGNMDGTGWTSLNDNLQMSSIKMVDVLHHSNGVRLLVADGGDNFFFSDEDGTTWDTASGLAAVQDWGRSEERRVGKECSSRWSPDH